MNNEQITNNKFSRARIIRNISRGIKSSFILFSLFFVLLIGCSNPFDIPETNTPDNGTTVSLNFAIVGQSARTAFPPTAFAAYEVFFSKTDGVEGGKVDPNEPGGLTFKVEAGIVWHITVKAYVGSVSPENLAATGKEKVTPAANVNTPVTVNLVGTVTTGTGTFEYNITKPAEAVIDVISLQKIDGMTLGENKLSGTEASGTIETIDAGFYLFSIELSIGKRKAGGIEAVHIYNGLDTTYNANFNDSEFFIHEVISELNILVPAPSYGKPPVTAITPAHGQYTGTVTWQHSETEDGTFTAHDAADPFDLGFYKAVITLSAAEGYTLQGVDANTFTVNGKAASHDADTGLVTSAVFPEVAAGFVITGTAPNNFTATRGSVIGTGTITDVITAIQNAVGDDDVIIQFGEDDELNIGTATVSFSGTWGEITLQGSIASTNVTASQGTITTAGGVNIISYADITNEANGRAVWHGGTGAVTIAGGEIKAPGNTLHSTGTINITGGFLTNTTHSTSTNAVATAVVTAAGSSNVNVSGGIIQGGGSRAIAISRTGSGKITISENALVTSEIRGEGNTQYEGGTIRLAGTATGTDTVLEMTGGTVRNTSSTGSWTFAIFNGTNGIVEIKGGTVGAMDASGTVINNRAVIWNNSASGTGTINISQADPQIPTLIISATTAAANSLVENNAGGRVNISGGTLRTTDRAIHNNAGGTVNITGGTVESTDPTYAYQTVLNNAAGTIIISGGTVSNASNNAGAFAVQSSANASSSIVLGGSPVINGRIRPAAGRLSVVTSVGDQPVFAPNGKTYTLSFAPNVHDMIIVTNGAGFENDFILDDPTGEFKVAAKSSDLVALSKFLYVVTGTNPYTITREESDSGYFTVQDAINYIKSQAGSNPVAIQFGSGADVLNIGTTSASFNDNTWGLITLTGKITSASATTNQGTIVTAGTVNINSSADITVTSAGENGRAIYHGGTGTITITGGTVSATTGRAIHNASTGVVTISGTDTIITSENITNTAGTIVIANTAGTNDRLNISGGTVENTAANQNARTVNNLSPAGVTISGGTVSAATGYAVNNASTGNITITGGTISATTYRAINNAGSGTINVSEANSSTPTLITAATDDTTEATIVNNSSGRVNIHSGTVRSASNSSQRAIAIRNSAANSILVITGGTLEYTYSTNWNMSGLLSNYGTTVITGGSISGNTDLNTVRSSDNNSRIILGGSPTIRAIQAPGAPTAGNGVIVITAANQAALQTSLEIETLPLFAPATTTYRLSVPTWTAGNIAVREGASFLESFVSTNASWRFVANNNDLVIATNP